jgi:hypothetical protein
LWYNINVNKSRGTTEMVKIEFEYKDELSRGKWNKQSCVVSSVEECKKIYGLGVDCEYRIISVEEVNNND